MKGALSRSVGTLQTGCERMGRGRPTRLVVPQELGPVECTEAVSHNRTYAVGSKEISARGSKQH